MTFRLVVALLLACPWVAGAQEQPKADDAAVDSRFFASYGAHFTVLFEGPADEALARRAVEVLDAAYYRIGAELQTFPDRLITVVLYTQEQFRDVTKTPKWVVASYDGRIRVPMRGALEQPQELERVLAHEFTHALVRSIVPRGLPQWLNEGLAVNFERDGAMRVALPSKPPAAGLSLKELSGSFFSLSPEKARLAYIYSAMAVRRMLDEAGPAAVVALLHDLAAGEPLQAAFERRFLMPLDSVAQPSQ